MALSHKSTVLGLASDVKSGSLRDREKAVDDLTQLLNPRNRTANLIDLGDKGYHDILEAIFSFVLQEKSTLYNKRKSHAAAVSAANRLSKCAHAVRVTVGRGSSKFKQKTLLAIIDHITQVLPGPNDDFVQPLLQDYVKALVDVLSRQANVELLARRDGAIWEVCMDFFLDLAHFMVPDEGDPITPSGYAYARASPAPGTAGTVNSRSTTRSAASTQSQKRTGHTEGGPLRDVLEGIQNLIQAANAPILRRQKDITDIVVRILLMKHLSLGSIQTLCFAIANNVFEVIQAEELEDALSLVNSLIPLMAYWWRAEKVSQDELIRALRNEISRAIFLTHLHLKRLYRTTEHGIFHNNLEELAERIWTEYAKRGEAFRLQLADVSFSSHSTPSDYLRNSMFSLRPHNVEGESYWAIVQNLAFLESILQKGKSQGLAKSTDKDEQPRKKRRIRESNSRLRAKLRTTDPGIRRTALQLIPFILTDNSMSDDEISGLVSEVVVLASHKDPITSSWALVACASCIPVHDISPSQIDIWRQLWHLATRSVSLPATSRAACVILQTMLRADVLPYHSISEEMNSIVTTADVNGPALLADTSISLMLYLLYVRNTRLPSASQATCNHIIRWIFMKWNPSDQGFASFQSSHVLPTEVVHLLRTCCGMKALSLKYQPTVSGGPLSIAWKLHNELASFIKYLLLLDDGRQDSAPTTVVPYQSQIDIPVADSGNFYASRKLILELFQPKIESLTALCESWTKKSSEGGIQISLERFQSLLNAVVIGFMLLPLITGFETSSSLAVDTILLSLAEKSIEIANESIEPASFRDAALRLLSPCIPDLNSSSLSRFRSESPGLLHLLSRLSDILDSREAESEQIDSFDLTDIDHEFDSQVSRGSTASTLLSIPRYRTHLSLHAGAFYTDTRHRLMLMRIIHNDEGQIGLLPDSFVQNILQLSDDGLLLCQQLLTDLFKSDLVPSHGTATDVVQRLGAIVSQSEYQCSEVALTTCIEIVDGLQSIWQGDEQHLSEIVGDLYNHFVKVCLASNIFSRKAQISMSQLLLKLLRNDPEYGTRMGLDSCRTSLLNILSQGSMAVKVFISDQIANVFDIYILKLHDEVFLDLLHSLPKDPDNTAGIAFRLHVLSKLACRWPTLLRRCTYHVFEAPGKIAHSVDYATRCLYNIAEALGLKSPKHLFQLFSRQLLYTWLEHDLVADIPFSIFGFTSLVELVQMAQAEAVGLMVMRGQFSMCADLAKLMGISESELIRSNFTTALTYSMIYGDASKGDDQGRGEKHVEKVLGSKALAEATHLNFVDMVALLFDLIDQDNLIEKIFVKHRDLAQAGEIMKAIKAMSHSPNELPPNQQPVFKARFLVYETQRLCEQTVFEFRELWTPSLVVAVARKLMSSVHPALGSLHACSVLRKVRILICLAGPVALEAYTLEMLLNATRGFIVDAECADDALGISQYLLSEGARHLSQIPSFVAGYALSTLASLRVFLESTQASTTQESQFLATMDKAQQFHGWLTEYLSKYTSLAFKSPGQRDAFKSITESAASIRSTGNADKGTSESKLLIDILRDSSGDEQLLDESSRQLALSLLCNDFSLPARVLDDVVESDENAIAYAAEVWKSTQSQNLSASYLTWAGRVMGRSFSASGDVPLGVLRETELAQLQRLAPESNGSEMGLLSLLQELTADSHSATAGLAEAALRKIISRAIMEEDEVLVMACQRTLTESLFLASQWGEFQSPPSENQKVPEAGRSAWTEDISSPAWLQGLCVQLAQSVPRSIILSVLPSILSRVSGFARRAFPFIVHLVLLFQLDQQQSAKRFMSSSLKQWLACTDPEAKENLKLLLNTIVYLRTQEYPKETSIADRAHWLETDASVIATAASRCGMHKTALLFAELASSESHRASRRSSAAVDTDLTSTLLIIFENIDDPDAYYGLPEDASLSKVLARVEYENEGSKSLAFRGAQYDSNLRYRDNTSETDAQALVTALSTLGLSGLSHSLIQTQESIGAAPSSLESTFGTARKLEIWNLSTPAASDHHAVVAYRAFQAIHQGAEADLVRSAIYAGFQGSMQAITAPGLNATAIRQRLGALATLTELDEVMNVADVAELERLVDKFQSRSAWMKRGLYADVSNILSCRGTTMSMLSQHASLVRTAKITVADLRHIEVKSLLMSSGIYRYHQATQETINISTSLMKLIPACEEQGLHVDAAVKMETANSLWDHGEMSTSISMLQGIDRDAALKKQTIAVSRSDLLSKIGHQVSVARLEKPHDIQKKYLEPALSQLKGTVEGKQAGAVYHQFATFCDSQLQDPAGLEDLARLQGLRSRKRDEVAELQTLIASTKDTQQQTKWSNALTREKQWLSLDEQELRRVELTRSEFVRLSLENYLLSLIASDDYNSDALRFIALWLERAAEDTTNKAVARYLHQVPTRKFATLMSQLTSRLQNQDNAFQRLLMELVYTICVDHPYHGMYQMWSGTKARAQQRDEVAVSRVKATEKVAQRVATTQSVAQVWLAIDKTSKYYHLLAMDKNPSRYKSGMKIAVKDVSAATNLVNYLVRYRIPPPTMHIELSVTRDYSSVPTILKLEPSMTIASGVSAPKIITAVSTDGVRYKQLVKGGHDDLRQDAIMEQVFAAVSSLLKLHRATQQRNLGIRTYKVLPLTASSGLIEFVPNTIPLHEFLMPAHERYFPKDLKGSQCRKEIYQVQNKATETRISTYRKVTDRFHPVMRYFFMEYFVDPDEWFVRRLAYTRSTAAISMLGHVLGLGDRHGHNILLDTKTGEAVHIDLGVAFEAGRILPVPELVPFRLTRDIVDGMGVTKTEGVFRRCCEFTLSALREEQYSIMTILDVLRYDPLYTWSISPLRLAKLQKARNDDEMGADEAEQSEAEPKKAKKVGSHVNEPSEADRALEIVRKKLSKTLSVTATVNDLINQAMDEANLAVLYSGWAAYA